MMLITGIIALSLLPSARAAAPAASSAVVLCEDIRKPFFRLERGKAVAQRTNSLAASFALPKPAGVRRVFVLGESVASLLGTPEWINLKIPENIRLQTLSWDPRLTPRPASVKIPGLETINCGMGGYDSRRILGVFREILAYEPDLIIILSGNNESAGYPCGGLSFELRRRGRNLLERFYGWRYGKSEAAARASLKLHELRLDDMAKEAGRRKIPVIFCTLPANISGMPPGGTPPLALPGFAAGMAALEQKRFAEAAGLFSGNLRNDPYDLFSRFYLGRALESAGRFKEARAEYSRVLDLDPRQDRASPERNAMIRRVAARRGAGLCDLEAVFYALSPNALPGFRQITDGVHWWDFYSRLVWAELSDAAGSMGLASLREVPRLRPAVAFGPVELRKTFSYAVSSMENFSTHTLKPEETGAGILSEKALAEITFAEAVSPGLMERTALSKKAFSDFLIKNFWSMEFADRLEKSRPYFIAHLAEMERRRGNFARALRLIGLAMAAQPDKPYYGIIKALALSGLGRKSEAEKELSSVCARPELKGTALAAAEAHGLKLKTPPPSPARASGRDRDTSKKLSDEGVARMSTGDPAGAERLLAEAIRINPGNAEALLSLCSLRLAKKGSPEAAQLCGAVPAAAEFYPPSARQTLLSELDKLNARIKESQKQDR